MQIVSLHIKNYKFIEDLEITEIEQALILVGKNSSGKSSILNALRAVGGDYCFSKEDFNEKKQNIEIEICLKITEEDLYIFHKNGIVGTYKRYEAWKREFYEKFPSLQDGLLRFTFIQNIEQRIRYSDGFSKHNKHIKKIFPNIYFMDIGQNLNQMQEDILTFQEHDLLKQMRKGSCLFNQRKQCTHCFSCIGLIEKKPVKDINVFETFRLLEYKLYQTNLNDFSDKVNDYFKRNGGNMEEICYVVECDANHLFQVKSEVYNKQKELKGSIDVLGKGMRNIYMLSLLEAYLDGGKRFPSIIMVEDPETALHPKLQKVSSEVLYRLSKKTQVIFTTHAPNLLYNFNSRQIRQIYRDDFYNSKVKEKTDIDAILDELGYSANDLMNVNFVFIVEGKQDKNRLPLLLNKYYSEIYDEDGKLSRISIITTNSCTNIKTYANLKYMNKVYLKDQFLMIRDGDGKDPEELARGLCKYYDQRNQEDIDSLPRVTRKNVLILKYYSFENYFLNPVIMVKIGVIEEEEQFYQTLFQKWKEYLHRLKSGRHLVEVIGKDIETVEDVKHYMEQIKTYLRGHNLFDIFYGPFKKSENELLKRYVEIADRTEFNDILAQIDHFFYFENRKKTM